MSNDKITAPVREPYDAMGPIDTPNPPAVRATLADVQPGGRVRLGDQAERARFEAWGRSEGLPLARGKLGGYAFEVTAKAWCAWQYLSAQPSPGGQGGITTAMVDAAACVLAKWAGYDDGSRWVHEARDALVTALAARQPVGEPVALGETDPIPCAWSDDDASSLVTLRDALRKIIAGTTTKDAAHFLKQPGQRRMTIKDAQEAAAAHLPYVESLVHRSQGYAAPPAQAVDLGAVRALLQRRIEQWRSHLPADPGALGTREIETKGESDYNNDVAIYRQGIAVMEEVLFKIDSKAVGNG